MLIKTTLNIKRDILEKLNETAEITGKSRTYIITILFKRAMRNNQKLVKFGSRIRYQGRDASDCWHKFHLILNEYEYEYCLDMRKLYKMSVSFILAYSVINYLHDIMNELSKNNLTTDNYYYKNYILSKKVIDNIICWKLYWGVPQKIDKLYHL